MAITRILHWLGNTFIICALLMVICAFASLTLLDVKAAISFSLITMGVGVIGVTFIFLTFNTPAKETNADALVFLLLFWIIVPCIMATPYYLLAAEATPMRAYFEAVSAFTTTGASTYSADALSNPLLLWRSMVQWFGGVCVATFAVVILAALNLSGTGVHRSMLFTLKKGELFERLLGIGRVIASVYATLSLFCFALLIVSGTDIFSALCLSLTSVSTGGLTPNSGPLATYMSGVSAFFLALFCLIGAFNIAVIWDLFRLRSLRVFRSMFTKMEHRALLIVALGLTFVGIFTVGLENGYGVFIESLFFVSTAGFDYNVIGLEMVPSALLIAVALIGGSALSTAGGLKMIRLLLLFRHLGTDLGRLSHPSRIIPVTLRAQSVPDRAFISIWMYFFGYTVVAGIGILVFSATGLVFEDAVAVTSATLSNFGPLLPATLPESGLAYSDFTNSQMIASTIFMILGRVEVLAVFILFSPGFWRQ